MKIIVTHASPDWDAITSVWLIKKYLSGWQDAAVEFVPAGERLKNYELYPPGHKRITNYGDNPIEKIGDDEVIHVDTGLGPLDHHQTSSDQICGASLTWDYVQTELGRKGDALT